MNFFLRDVWKQSKIVFAFFVVFILGTMWCTFSKIEITPFFLWAHYSDQQTSTGKFERVYIEINGEHLDLPKLSRPTREMIQLPLEYFVQLERANYETGTRQILRKKFGSILSKSKLKKMEKRLCNSRKDVPAFLKWLVRYIESIYGVEVEEMELGICELVVERDHSVTIENKSSFAQIEVGD